MAWTNDSEPGALTWTTPDASDNEINVGQPMGLLLALTYAVEVISGWSNASEGADPSWSNDSEPS